ncbi:hypothetical protein ACLOJK_020324 [Asimina triloba]
MAAAADDNSDNRPFQIQQILAAMASSPSAIASEQNPSVAAIDVDRTCLLTSSSVQPTQTQIKQQRSMPNSLRSDSNQGQIHGNDAIKEQKESELRQVAGKEPVEERKSKLREKLRPANHGTGTLDYGASLEHQIQCSITFVKAGSHGCHRRAPPGKNGRPIRLRQNDGDDALVSHHVVITNPARSQPSATVFGDIEDDSGGGSSSLVFSINDHRHQQQPATSSLTAVATASSNSTK